MKGEGGQGSEGNEHRCCRTILARGCIASVERCTCGVLYLMMGPFSLRLSVDQYKSLLGTMLEAQGSLLESLDALESSESRGIARAEGESPAADSALRLAALFGQRATRGES